MNLLASSQAIGVTKFRHSLKTVARLTHVRGAYLVDSQPLTSVASPIRDQLENNCISEFLLLKHYAKPVF